MSLYRGRGLQEVSEQLFGNIKRKYGRKDSQRVLSNTHNAELWVKHIERGGEGLQDAEEKQRVRREETQQLLLEEREEKSNMRRRGEEDDREMPMLTEEGKGRKKRIRKAFHESFSMEDQSEQLLDVEIPEKFPQGPPDPKVASKMVARKRESGLIKRAELDAEKAGRGENGDSTERREDRKSVM